MGPWGPAKMACMSLAVLGSWVALWAMVGGCCSRKVAQGRGRSCTAVGSSHRIQIAEGDCLGLQGQLVLQWLGWPGG